MLQRGRAAVLLQAAIKLHLKALKACFDVVYSALALRLLMLNDG